MTDSSPYNSIAREGSVYFATDGSASFGSVTRTKCFWDCPGLIQIIYFFSLLILQALTSKHQFRPQATEEKP